ncbi:hypothetical protein ILYODFUR_008350 [Ilyodon furcidens]|uniref:Uncharacterized protein n=1 Tax=Ilyodon furcidens TaxID=33524 RepID=A0ABV0UT31_9TELE
MVGRRVSFISMGTLQHGRVTDVSHHAVHLLPLLISAVPRKPPTTTRRPLFPVVPNACSRALIGPGLLVIWLILLRCLLSSSLREALGSNTVSLHHAVSCVGVNDVTSGPLLSGCCMALLQC